MAGPKDLLKNLAGSVSRFFTPPEGAAPGTSAQRLQEALGREIELAEARKQAAQSSMVAAGMLREELAKLVGEHEALGKLAVKRERAGDTQAAREALGLQLKLKERIEEKARAYKESDQRAADLIVRAREQYAKVEKAENELPQRILQLELNRMREDAQKMEDQARTRLEGVAGFDALAKSIDLQTAMLDAGHLLSQGSGENLAGQVAGLLSGEAFDRAYEELKAKARELPGDVVEAELVEGGDAVSEAKSLLSGPAFGGALKK